jgi:hypothetical protein
MKSISPDRTENEPQPNRPSILHSRVGHVRKLARTLPIRKIQFHKGDYASAGLAARGHKISHQGVVNIVKAQGETCRRQ